MSTVSQRLPGNTGVSGEIWAGRLLWGLFSVACVFYAVLAFDYFLSFAAGRTGFWLTLFSALVSDEHAFGTGSVHSDQVGAYAAGFNFMLMHTTMGAIAMALGPFQFMSRVRRRWPVAHRTTGKIYLAGVVLSMVGGLAYLGTTPMTAVFSGPPFWVALVGLDLAVLVTAWFAYAAIRVRDIPRHRSWMAFNFGLLLATPGLRLLWITFGWFFPDMNQAADNLAIMTFLLPLCVTFMLLWVAAQQPRPRRGNAA